MTRNRYASSILLFLAVAASAPAIVTGPAAARAAEETPAPDRAEAEQKARAHYARGEAAFQAERYQEALSEFESGYATVPRPGFLINMGHAQRKLGDLRKARSLYRKFLLVDPATPLRAEVTAVITELDSALSEEDRALLAAPTAPLSPPSLVPVPRTLVARNGRDADEAPPPPAPLYRRPWFWVAAGALAAGAGLGLYAWQRSSGDDFHSSGSLGSLGP